MNEPSGAARLVSPEAARCSSCTCALADSSIAHRSVFRPAGRQPAILRAMQCSAVQCSAVQCFAIAAAIQLHTSMRQSVCVRRISGGPPRAPIKCHFNCFGGARVRRSPLPLCCCARPALSFNARVGRLPFSVAASRSETRASRVESSRVETKRFFIRETAALLLHSSRSTGYPSRVCGALVETETEAEAETSYCSTCTVHVPVQYSTALYSTVERICIEEELLELLSMSNECHIR